MELDFFGNTELLLTNQEQERVWNKSYWLEHSQCFFTLVKKKLDLNA